MNINITDPIFHNEDAAQAHCEASRWNGEPSCPHCGSVRIARLKGKTQTVYFLCNDCRDKFTVRTGSVMERSHVPLHKWLLAFHLMAASKKGMSAKQMERMLGVTYKTAWFLCHRVREAMDGAAPTGTLGGPDGTVEADETYVGGKARNRATRKPAKKKAVVALVERDGRARSFHVANVNAKDVRALIVTNIDRASALLTDESPTRLDRAHLAIGRAAPGFSREVAFSGGTDGEGRLTIEKLEGLDGLPVLVEHNPDRSILLPVTGRGGVRYSPPREHLGKQLPDSLPLTVGRLGLAYLEALVSEAEERAA